MRFGALKPAGCAAIWRRRHAGVYIRPVCGLALPQVVSCILRAAIILCATLTALFLAFCASASPTTPRPRGVPQTISLTSRKAARGAAHARRALSPIGVPLTDYFNGTDLQ